MPTSRDRTANRPPLRTVNKGPIRAVASPSPVASRHASRPSTVRPVGRPLAAERALRYPKNGT
jgi:hypothetical protein